MPICRDAYDKRELEMQGSLSDQGTDPKRRDYDSAQGPL